MPRPIQISSDRYDDKTVFASAFPSTAITHTLLTAQSGVSTLPELSVPLQCIHYVTKPADLPDAMRALLHNFDKDHHALGFDTEFTESAKPGVDVLTLSSLPRDDDPNSIVVVIVHLSEIFHRERLWRSTPLDLPKTEHWILFKAVLEQAQYTKVGVNALSDQTRLQKCLNVKLAGVVNLSTFAVDMQAVFLHNMSLQQLVRCMLGKLLDKSSQLRRGDWHKRLTDPLKQYAAADAVASVLVWQHIKARRNPAFDDYDPAVVQVGARVLLLDQQSTRVVAEGTIVNNPGTTTKFLNSYKEQVSSTRVVVRLSKVLVPLATIPIALTPLQSRTTTLSSTATVLTKYDMRKGAHPTTLAPRLNEVESHPIMQGHVLVPQSALRPFRPIPAPVAANADVGDEWGQLAKTSGCVNATDMAAFLQSLPLTLSHLLQQPDDGCKGDVFHALKHTGDTIKKDQPDRAMFLSMLSDALLPIVAADLNAIEARMKAAGLSESDINKAKFYEWRERFLKHARRTSGPSKAEQLYRVLKVRDLFRDHKHPTDGEPLLRDKTLDIINNIAEAIAAGWYMDIPGVAMYTQVGEDSLGNPIFKTHRSTSQVAK